MYKEYMLKCECWNPLEDTWESFELFFDAEEEMREYKEKVNLLVKDFIKNHFGDFIKELEKEKVKG